MVKRYLVAQVIALCCLGGSVSAAIGVAPFADDFEGGCTAHSELMPGPDGAFIPTTRSEVFRVLVEDRRYLKLLETAMNLDSAPADEVRKAEAFRRLLRRVVHGHCGVRLDLVRDLCERFAAAMREGRESAIPEFREPAVDLTDFGLTDGPLEPAGVAAVAGFVNEKKYDVKGEALLELCRPDGSPLASSKIGAPDRRSHPGFVFPTAKRPAGEYLLRLVIDGDVKAETPFWLVAETGDAVTVSVDIAGNAGKVKPLNGIGQGPLIGWNDFSMFHYLKEANVPCSRTHDVGGPFGKNIYFDIPNIFRDFDADENDPSNYDFEFTDLYVKNLVENGVEPYFRLGVTIENAWYVKSYRIVPPKDFAKWARICERIIRHYNEGWADGFRYGIRRWEIWNEPDNCQGAEAASMWAAPFSEYMKLYETAATYLKGKFPALEIGGYGSSGLYYHTKGPSFNTGSGSRTEQLYNDFHRFVKFAAERKLPLDFFSFHGYDCPSNIVAQINYVRRVLDEAGYRGTKLSMNEWINESPMGGTARQAALVMSTVCGMQYSALDDSEIYDGRCGLGNYSPLFDPVTRRPRKLYYAWKWFGELRNFDRAVPVKSSRNDVWAMAAVKGGKAVVIVTNCGIVVRPLELSLSAGARITGCRLIDDGHTDVPVALPKLLAPNSVLRIELEARLNTVRCAVDDTPGRGK